MRKILIYDIPTRIFHWLTAVIFISAFIIAKTVDSESYRFSYHMLLGLTLLAVIVLRCAWGLWGSRYARFSSFELQPKKLQQYLFSVFKRPAISYLGHNPASSWVAIAMYCLGTALAFTGVLMVQGIAKDVIEDFHAILAYLFLAAAVAHILGIILHTKLHRDPIYTSMLNGKKATKTVTENSDLGIASSHGKLAVAFAVIIAFIAVQLVWAFDAKTRQLKLYGWTLPLGDNEKE